MPKRQLLINRENNDGTRFVMFVRPISHARRITSEKAEALNFNDKKPVFSFMIHQTLWYSSPFFQFNVHVHNFKTRLDMILIKTTTKSSTLNDQRKLVRIKN